MKRFYFSLPGEALALHFEWPCRVLFRPSNDKKSYSRPVHDFPTLVFTSGAVGYFSGWLKKLFHSWIPVGGFIRFKQGDNESANRTGPLTVREELAMILSP